MSDHKGIIFMVRILDSKWDLSKGRDLIRFVFWKDYPGSSIGHGLWELENLNVLPGQTPPVAAKTIGVL